MTIVIAVLLIGGSIVAALIYNFPYIGLNIEKSRIRRELKEKETQPTIQKTRLSRTTIVVILVVIAIILLPITLAAIVFTLIWQLIFSNLSGFIRLLFGYWWAVIVCSLAYYLYPKFGVVIIIGAIGALIPPLWATINAIVNYLQERYERAFKEVIAENKQAEPLTTVANYNYVASPTIYGDEYGEYETEYSELPLWGQGEKGMSTSEFADLLGLDELDRWKARSILEKWRKQGIVAKRMSRNQWRWYQKESRD
jgi:hypothetical protein